MQPVAVDLSKSGHAEAAMPDKRKPVSSLLAIVAVAVGAYGLLLVYMFIVQPRLVFLPDLPSRTLGPGPDAIGLAYEDIHIETEDNIRLHGWFVPAPAARGVVLFFHGNAGNISHRRESIELFHHLGLNVFIIDYRGYGRSEGSPSEQGLYQDANAAWLYLTAEKGFDPENVIIFGRSLGGAAAAKLASGVQARGLILESTLSSARDFARAVFRILSRLVVMRYDFNIAQYIQRVNYPVLVLHSPEDEIMPFHLGEKVYDLANQPKHFVRMRGDHNNGFLLSQPEYQQELDRWLKTL